METPKNTSIEGRTYEGSQKRVGNWMFFHSPNKLFEIIRRSSLNSFILWLMIFLLCAAYCQADEWRSVFFIAETQQSWQIFRINQDGTDLSQITSSQCDVLNLSSVVDSQKLLLACSGRKTYILDLKTKKKIEIKTDMTGAIDTVISRDNQSLLFSLSSGGANDANHIWLTDIPTNKSTQLTHMEGMQHSPIWSHDDKSIFFLSGNGGQNENIWRLDVYNGSLNQLTAGQLYNFDISCSIHDELAFSSNRSGNYEIWTMDTFGGNIRQLTKSPEMDSQPSWSPDGERLVFVSNRGGYPAIYIMDREGKSTRKISPDGLICRNPVWGR